MRLTAGIKMYIDIQKADVNYSYKFVWYNACCLCSIKNNHRIKGTSFNFPGREGIKTLKIESLKVAGCML